MSKNSRSHKPIFVPPTVLPYAPKATSCSENSSNNTSTHRSRQGRKNISISTTHSTFFSPSATSLLSRKTPVLSPCTSTDVTESPISLQTSSSSRSVEPLTPDPEPSQDLFLIPANTREAAHLSVQSDISVWAEPPSPMTAKMKQHSKLRRFLGESIPAELVYGEKDDPTHCTRMTHSLKDVPEETDDYTYWKVAPGPDEVEHCDLNGVEEDLSDQGKALEMRWGATEVVNFRCPTSKRHTQRFSGKWVEEKSGRRWVAGNYRMVLDALRKL